MEKKGFNRPIRSMIFIGFALAFLMLFIMGYTAYSSVSQMAITLQRFTEPNAYVENLKSITDKLIKADGHVNAYSIAENPGEKAAYEEIMESLQDNLLDLEIASDTLEVDKVMLDSFIYLFLDKGILLDSTINLVEAVDSVSLFDTLVNSVNRELRASNRREKSKIPQIKSVETTTSDIKQNQGNSPQEPPVEPLEEEKEATGIKKMMQDWKVRREEKKAKRAERKQKNQEESEAIVQEDTSNATITSIETPVNDEPKTSSSKPTGPSKDRLALRKLRREIEKLKVEQQKIIQNDRKLQAQLRSASEKGSKVLIDIISLVRDIELEETQKDEKDAKEAKTKFEDNSRLVGSFSLVVLLLCAVLISVIFNDISRTRKLQAKLRKEKKLAESLTKAKEEFLANMSHEIRTPMNAVIGFSEQLAGTKLSTKQSGFLQPIRSSAVYLLNLINDILDASKIDSGHFKLEEIGFSPEEVIDEVQSTFDASAESKDIGLSCTISQDVPQILIGDPLRLKQMIFNLVSNAIKFTSEGHVAVHCKLVSRKEDSALLAFRVKDTGIGIAEDRLKTIFEEFVQADNSTTRKFGGTGLGLSITKKLAEMHGGYVDVKSEIGKGTEITLYIPYAPGSEKDLEIMVSDTQVRFDQLKGRRALVADDEPYNRLLIEAIMEKWGVELESVENGQKVLDLIEKGEEFDFILMDLQMPEVDGLEAGRRIREEMKLDVPILALTATATEQEIARSLEMGMNAHLLKPFKERELYALLINVLKINDSEDPTSIVEENIPDPTIKGENDEKTLKEEKPMANYNLDELYRLANKNKDFMKNMLNIFVTNTNKNLIAMREGLDKEDWKEISMRAHKIIPPSRHLGLKQIVSQLKYIELEAMNETSLDSLPDAVRKVASEIEETVAAIQKDIDNMG